MRNMIFILCFFIPFYVYGSDKKVNEVETLVKKPLSENDFEVKTNQNNKVSLTSLKNKRYAIYTDLSLRDQDYFSRKTHFKADIVNKSEHALKVILWVVGSNGWDAVPDVRELKPHEKQTFSCHLRETFPDGTHKINPNKVKFVQVMLPIAKVGDQLSIENFRTEGDCELWIKPKQRLEVPEMSEGKPQAGKRVRFSLDSSLKNNKYGVLYLPADWQASKKYPIIVEMPGNIYYVKGCYSTGRPEHCVMGYGMTKGKGAIWLSMPFLESDNGPVAENKWGSSDSSAQFIVEMVKEVCRNYGGDEDRVVMTGFSRGAIACGYIGLRNKEIAALWKGIHICQHYDGDGWGGAIKQDALNRIKCFSGESIFCTDNDHKVLKDIFQSSQVKATFVNSGIGAHSCAMFLDDRPSTIKVRAWFEELVKKL